ncbi:MAG: alpha/beta fold hydrolase [Roseburia sp.]|nr:alpha/beta fold hydrolase [Roseburia sp.]
MEQTNLRTITIEKYYGSLPNMKAKYDRLARKDFFNGSSVEEFEAWRTQARATLSELIGLEKMDNVQLFPVTEETVTLENGIVREKVLIQSEQDVWVPMYILIPPVEDGEEAVKRRVFIAPPGHQGAGKYSVAGCSEIPAVADAIRKFNYDYGMQLARMGFVVICPDCRGFGERRDEKKQGDDEEAFLTSSCFHLAHMAEPLGETVIGMCTWDLMKIVDYVETRTEWDCENLSCLGFSGGGMQTLYFAALDERIRNVFISGYMYGFKDSLMILNGNCSCNYVPHLWEHFDMGDIGSLIAPRNLMIQSCRADHLNGPRGLENVYEQLAIIKNAYRLFDAQEHIVHDIHEGGHCWHDDNLAEIIEKFEIRHACR